LNMKRMLNQISMLEWMWRKCSEEYQCKSALTYDFFYDLHFGQHNDYLWSDHNMLVFHQGHNILMMKT
jgi:hypothetical protein